MTARKYLQNKPCPHCGDLVILEEVSRFTYSPPMTNRKLISQITRCPNCNEMVGTVSKYQLREECEENV